MTAVRLRLILIGAIVLSTVACDQSTKHIARANLKDRVAIQVLGRFFVLKYAENQGAFLSMGANWPVTVRSIVFKILSAAIVLAAASSVLLQKSMPPPGTAALSLIVGGGIGNLWDRLIRDGLVSDFMNIGIGNIRTGIFNFADIFLLAGVVLLLFAQLRKKEGSP